MHAVDPLTESVRELLVSIAEIARFSGRFFLQVFRPPFEFGEFLNQAYRIGYKSLFLVSITGFIIGMVMTLQTKPTLETFGAESWLPSMVSVSIIREIGPVLTALICAGKVASGIGAELGSMKVTEQVDAMTVSGASAFNYLVVTRVVAATLMVPLLVIYADAISLVGSFVGVNMEGDVTWNLFFRQSLDILVFSDFVPAFIKTFFFGFAIGIIGCYKGLTSAKGTAGVGQSATSAVVLSSVMIFILDLLAVQITQLLV